ncbi:unnamed protein product [Fraxinus pennsylvanica]|uniref:HTH myb-type domain-containing protein n=1 Tax=Fraxinus pennsylvanica TaxID=56036 RepID=A0AAD2A2Y3_9LAMI|nr:unnamed protein product [Fraxinus pennsylvanica]
MDGDIYAEIHPSLPPSKAFLQAILASIQAGWRHISVSILDGGVDSARAFRQRSKSLRSLYGPFSMSTVPLRIPSPLSVRSPTVASVPSHLTVIIRWPWSAINHVMVEEYDPTHDGSDPNIPSFIVENCTEDQLCPAKSQKRARLVWTSKLHKRFLDVVEHLGLKNAGPNKIVQIMNVDGLTRENVASHLQKYRLYNKRKKESPSASDHMFASAPVFRQQSFNESPSAGNVDYRDCGQYGIMPIPMP